MRSTARRWAPRALVPSAAALVLCLVVAGCGGTEISPPRASGADTAADEAAATALLDRLEQALRRPRSAAGVTGALAASDGAARRTVAALVGNAAALRLRQVRLDWVEEVPPPDAALRRWGADTLAATVSVGWRLPEDDAASRVDATVVFDRSGRVLRVADVTAAAERSALWLLQPVRVRRSARAVVVSSADGVAAAGAIAPLARRALLDVRRVIPAWPGWDGTLVVEVPRSAGQVESLLGAEEGEYADIAAVTTPTGSGPDSPVHVFVNPDLFDRLGPQGRQVVLSHEATHRATDATRAGSGAGTPPWLLEGFADYVALAHAGVPVRTAARQALREVREDGPPDRLPTAADLSPSAQSLGATYEAAWTACRFMAQTYGERALVDLYRSVDGGRPTPVAFREVLGTTQPAFVRAWRADLVRLAG